MPSVRWSTAESTPALIEVGSTAVAKREALERSAPVLLSALSLDEGRDRLYARPISGLSFPRRFVIVCRSLASLGREQRDFIAFLRRNVARPIAPGWGCHNRIGGSSDPLRPARQVGLPMVTSAPTEKA